ncbi:MAG: DUF4202 domain-containing protein [Dehalococcoidia bacterium]|nr:DUF4202 domain-containing protein [Dehalococcoidia bacterium]
MNPDRSTASKPAAAPEGVRAPAGVDAARFLDAIARIDAANAQDPTTIVVRGAVRPKELAHAELATEWAWRLREASGTPPSEALLLAARAHHIERWTVPRASYPDGRAGYLQWRTGLYQFHASRAAQLLAEAGYDAATIEATSKVIRKERPRGNPDAQALEDALCLVFLETQLNLDWRRIDDDKMVEVLRKTWRKMSQAGRDAALGLQLDERERAIVARALGA